MRNHKLVDGVMALHDIARMVKEETDHMVLHDAIRACANRLHEISIAQYHASQAVTQIINQAKQ
jgi:hypothetical protein